MKSELESIPAVPVPVAAITPKPRKHPVNPQAESKSLTFIAVLLIGIVLSCLIAGAIASNKTGSVEQTQSDLELNAWISAKSYVEGKLKAPATAKWSNSIDDKGNLTYGALSNHNYEAWGYVDAQNSFGALLREDWYVALRAEGGKWRVLYSKIGDMEYGDKDAVYSDARPTYSMIPTSTPCMSVSSHPCNPKQARWYSQHASLTQV
jgi:hypothetical protein